MSSKASSNVQRAEKKRPSRSSFHAAVTSEITPAPLNAVQRPQQPANAGRQGQLGPQSKPVASASSTRASIIPTNPLDRALSAPPFDVAFETAVLDERQVIAQRQINTAHADPVERAEALTMKTITESMKQMSVESLKVKKLLEQHRHADPRDSPELMAQVQRALAVIAKSDEKVAACTDNLKSASAQPDISTRRGNDNAGGSKRRLKTTSATLPQENTSTIRTTSTRSTGPASRR